MMPKIGDRVRVTGVLPNDPAPIPVGDEGEVTWVSESAHGLHGQIGVEWDSGRTLMLLEDDPWEVVHRG